MYPHAHLFAFSPGNPHPSVSTLACRLRFSFSRLSCTLLLSAFTPPLRSHSLSTSRSFITTDAAIDPVPFICRGSEGNKAQLQAMFKSMFARPTLTQNQQPDWCRRNEWMGVKEFVKQQLCDAPYLLLSVVLTCDLQTGVRNRSGSCDNIRSLYYVSFQHWPFHSFVTRILPRKHA